MHSPVTQCIITCDSTVTQHSHDNTRRLGKLSSLIKKKNRDIDIFNLLRPKSDQHQISPCNINAL